MSTPDDVLELGINLTQNNCSGVSIQGLLKLWGLPGIYIRSKTKQLEPSGENNTDPGTYGMEACLVYATVIYKLCQ
jgi:hypothetical protein